MSRATPHGIAWLLLGIMPFYTSTAVLFDLVGPVHHHHHHEDGDHAHGHGHAHAHIERHRHPAGDPSMVRVDDHAAPDFLARESGGTSGWSATMCAALVSHGAWSHPPRAGKLIAPEQVARWHSHSPGCPERPPPIPLA